MSPIQILSLLLAVSVSLHVGTVTGLAARRAGVSAGNALVTGAGAVATSLAVYFAAVSAYR